MSGTFEGIPKGNQFNGVWDNPSYHISTGNNDQSPNGDGSLQALALVNKTSNGISPLPKATTFLAWASKTAMLSSSR